jgi:hypothetical protein
MYLSHITSILFILAPAALGQVLIPADLGDGIYSGSLDFVGQPSITKIGDLPADSFFHDTKHINTTDFNEPVSIKSRNEGGKSIEKRYNTGCHDRKSVEVEYVGAFQSCYVSFFFFNKYQENK